MCFAHCMWIVVLLLFFHIKLCQMWDSTRRFYSFFHILYAVSLDFQLFPCWSPFVAQDNRAPIVENCVTAVAADWIGLIECDLLSFMIKHKIREEFEWTDVVFPVEKVVCCWCSVWPICKYTIRMCQSSSHWTFYEVWSILIVSGCQMRSVKLADWWL